MQYPYASIVLDGELVDLTDHMGEVAAIDGLSIEWGTSDPGSQPEPSVLDITLRDRDGGLAGAATRLNGSRIAIILSDQPTWTAITGFGNYDQQTRTWATLHQQWSAILDKPQDPMGICMFSGIVSSGGHVTRRRDDWLIEISATSSLLLWKRLQSQGPTSSQAKHAGQHWVGTPDERLTELNARAEAAGAPTATLGEIELPGAVRAYATSDSVSQLDLLHRLTAHSPALPLWYETSRWAPRFSTLDPLDLTCPAHLDITADGTLGVSRAGTTGVTLTPETVICDDTLSIPEPVTQITLTTQAATTDDGKLSYEDTETTYRATGLPDNLTTVQSSMTADSDAITADRSSGLVDGGTWTPTDADRRQVSDWLTAWNLRLRPDTVTIDGLKLDPAHYPSLYRTCPPPPILFKGGKFRPLTAVDSLPAFTGPYLAIGGVLTFSWTGGTPHLRHDLTIVPIPAATADPTWDALAAWTDPYDATDLTWTSLTLIHQGAS